MKKYFVFNYVSLKGIITNLKNNIGTVISFTIHILIFSTLWDFVLEGKQMAGYTKKDLIWYVIIAEAIIYSFYMYFRKIAYKVEMGDFAYDMTKPYNFLGRIIAEGFSEIVLTILILAIGVVLGIILAGKISITCMGIVGVTVVIFMAICMLLILQIIVGLSSIWLGRDVSSIWLLVQKSMLIFAFSPVELFPYWLQKPLLCLPTTHVIYTPAKLLVHFSKMLFVRSIIFEGLSIMILVVILIVIYKKGVRKQNVNGI